MIKAYLEIIENFRTYAGAGGLLVLLLAALVYLAFSLKEKEEKWALAIYPLIVLGIFFCPVWIVYFLKMSDGVILYRILWLIPMGTVVCFAIVRLIGEFKGAGRHIAFIAGVVLIILSGRYIYSNPNFTRAENVYHIPETVIKICDEIEVPGREIRACFPDEFVSYVRQYNATIFLTYGRGMLMDGKTATEYSPVRSILEAEVIDTDELVAELRHIFYTSPYLIVSSDRKFTKNLWEYDYCYVTTIDGYDIYLDNTAYIGLDLDYR